MEAVIKKRIERFFDPAQRIGATYVPNDGTYIRLWAPKGHHVEIEWTGQEKKLLETAPEHYYIGHFPDAKPGDRYMFHVDGKALPDPASRYQPEDVYGPSEVVTGDFAWDDQEWRGIPFTEWVIYEIHPGTFSSRHDFQGIIDDLPRLKALGITTIEIMPVSQFSGDRNWGYDGVFPHAVQNSYGGPAQLKELVKACHAQGLAILLDVVFNHVGPEGNVLFQIGEFTNPKYRTPWGDALNFDSEGSDSVRQYFLQAAWQWLTEYHFDGLRLDAVQMIFDTTPTPFMEELGRLKREAEKVVGRPLILIGETDMNDPRVLAPPENFGFGLDGHWADDLHHALQATLTGEREGYYADYGGADQIARIYRHSVAFDGQFSPFHNRNHGRSYAGIDQNRLIVETQNHDQVGNRLLGDRLTKQVDFERLKLAAAAVHLSPFTPFIFMGEEFASEQPFMYFISHHDAKLVEMVRRGRAEEWKSFGWKTEPPDPAAVETFESCVLHDKTPAPGSRGEIMQTYYKDLIALSKDLRRHYLEVRHEDGSELIALSYTRPDSEVLVLLSFSEAPQDFALPDAGWHCHLESGHYREGQEATKPYAVEAKVTVEPFSATVLRRTA